MQVPWKKLKYDELHNEGKKKMGWKIYELMSMIFMKWQEDNFIFAHTFLLVNEI